MVSRSDLRTLKALGAFFDRADQQFFVEWPKRQARMRLPYRDEMWEEFASLGYHPRERRRIIVWRVPEDNPYYDPAKRPLLKIPFVAFADKTIEDRDDVLLPILQQIMAEAFQREKAR